MVIWICLVASTSCSKKTTKGITQAEPTNANFTENLALDFKVESCLVNDKEVCFTLDSILEDSRCPTGLNCVWEGNAKPRFTMTTGGETFQFPLDTQPTSNFHRNDTTIGGYHITLKEITPYPSTEKEISKSDYNVTIVVSTGNN